MNTITSKKDFYYPPGGILIWIIIFMELITFGIASIFFLSEGRSNIDTFTESTSHLNLLVGTINTMILLISGYFAAISIEQFKKGDLKKSKRSLIFTLLGGLVFIILKSYEYFEKLEQGYTIIFNDFFSFYWLLTGFHLIHLLVGMVILLFLYRSLNRKGKDADPDDFEAGTAFWHMCDLIWLMLFPILYLIYLI